VSAAERWTVAFFHSDFTTNVNDARIELPTKKDANIFNRASEFSSTALILEQHGRAYRMQATSNGDLERSVRATIARVFRLSPAEAEGDLRIGAPPQWDSIGHMQLLVEIENDFDVRFPTHAIANLTTVETIAEAIRAQRETR
jgi:acyl carrier protein